MGYRLDETRIAFWFPAKAENCSFLYSRGSRRTKLRVRTLQNSTKNVEVNLSLCLIKYDSTETTWKI